MKKLLALVLALTMVFTMAITASASESDKVTTLFTTIPAASYTLNVPAETRIEYGEEITSIGNVTVTNAVGFASGKNLNVTVTYDAFKPDSDSISTTIPFSVKYSTHETLKTSTNSDTHKSGQVLVFKGLYNETVTERAVTDVDVNGKMTYIYDLGVYVSSANWGKALAGNYTGTISFSAEVVVE